MPEVGHDVHGQLALVAVEGARAQRRLLRREPQVGDVTAQAELGGLDVAALLVPGERLPERLVGVALAGVAAEVLLLALAHFVGRNLHHDVPPGLPGDDLLPDVSCVHRLPLVVLAFVVLAFVVLAVVVGVLGLGFAAASPGVGPTAGPRNPALRARLIQARAVSGRTP